MKNQYSMVWGIIALAGLASFFYFIPISHWMTAFGAIAAAVGAIQADHHNNIEYQGQKWSWFKKNK